MHRKLIPLEVGIQMILALAFAHASSIGLQIRHDLQSALQGVPLHGHRFRAAVGHVLARFPSFVEQTSPLVARDFIRPTGWAPARIVTIDHSDISLLVFKEGIRTKVQLISDQENLYFIQVRAARICNRLVQFGFYAGADHEIMVGRVFALANGRWRKAQSIEAEAEVAGDDSFRISNATIRFSMIEREPPSNIRDQCHACPHLRFEEHWTFADGRIRRSGRTRIPTALAEIDDLTGLARHNRRTAFNTHVPKAIRQKLWLSLRKVDNMEATGHTDQQDLSRSFEVMGGTIRLSKVEGRWRVTGFSRHR